jgi:hypothetical protein
MPASKRCPNSATSRFVAHAAVDRDERVRAALDGCHAIEGDGGGRDHAPAGFDDHLRTPGKMLAGGADECVEVLGDGGRLIGVAVPRPQATAEVVDVESAERRERRNGPGERCRVEDLRTDVHV